MNKSAVFVPPKPNELLNETFRFSLIGSLATNFTFPESIGLSKFKVAGIVLWFKARIEKITIVEGWEKKELNNILKSNFKKFEELDYSEVIADTYLFSEN